MTHIAFFEVRNWEKKYLAELLKGHKLSFFKTEFNLSTASKAKDAKILCVFTHSEINKKTLSKAKSVKYVCIMGTGFNNVVIEDVKKEKIPVSNVATYGEDTVAEYTFALLLSISRKIPQTIDRTKRANFSIKGLQGFDINGKTLGIIGMGSIGTKIARIANGFEMKVIAYDLHQDKKLAKKYTFKYVSMNQLLKTSDVISVNVPLNKHTHHLISKKKFDLMKNGTILLNTARGEIIDTKQLIKNLKNKKIAFAGLDVLEGEDKINEEHELYNARIDPTSLLLFAENHYLIRTENVLVTPHNAFNTNEAMQRILETTTSNIKSYLKGKIKNRVA